jgi:hypothetical protein
MKTLYLLPCACGRRLEINAGQAGAQIECGCGQRLTVPTIRGLKQLETVADSQPESKPAGWSTARGMVFSIGLLLAVVGSLFAAYQGLQFWRSRRLSDPVEFERQFAYQQVDAQNAVETLGEFRREEHLGLGQPYPPLWTEIDKLHLQARQWLIAGIVMAGVGLLATAGSMMGRPKSS